MAYKKYFALFTLFILGAGSLLFLTGCPISFSCRPTGQSCSRHSTCCSDNCEGGVCCEPVGDECEGGRLCCGEGEEGGLHCTGAGGPMVCCVPLGSPLGLGGATCEEDRDCCSGNCESGRCCFGEDQRGACSSNDDCCDGFYCSEETGRCEEPVCPEGCTWVNDSATFGTGGHCDCGTSPGDPGPGPDPGIAECTPCAPCATAPASEHHIVRVYNDESDFCCIAGDPPFWAPDSATAEECARLICGCVDAPGMIHCATEDVTHTENPYSSCF